MTNPYAPIPDSPVQPGDIVSGKYKVERVVGSGGMGVVVVATHLQLDQKVAIKFLKKDAADDKEAAARFAREARAAARIQGEHVARVHDVAALENGVPYLVMEYLNGKDLADLVHEKGALPVDVAVDYVLQACEAIAEAHAQGIVHRDLKPANLFLARRPDGTNAIKILDFGISKIMKGSQGSVPDPTMTKTSALMGSPLYMSPEQMRSTRDVDHRTDVWSLGVILFELVSGTPPFVADTIPKVCGMIIADPTPSLLKARRGVSPALEQVINKCTEKNPDQRYATIADLAEALRPFAPWHAHVAIDRAKRLVAMSSRTPTLGASTDASATDRTMKATPQQSGAWLDKSGSPGVSAPAMGGTIGEFGRTSRPSRRRRRQILIGAGAGAIAGLVVVAVAAVRLHRTQPGAGPDLPSAAAPAISTAGAVDPRATDEVPSPSPSPAPSPSSSTSMTSTASPSMSASTSTSTTPTPSLAARPAHPAPPATPKPTAATHPPATPTHPPATPTPAIPDYGAAH